MVVVVLVCKRWYLSVSCTSPSRLNGGINHWLDDDTPVYQMGYHPKIWTDTCENSTFPGTSYAGGKKYNISLENIVTRIQFWIIISDRFVQLKMVRMSLKKRQFFVVSLTIDKEQCSPRVHSHKYLDINITHHRHKTVIFHECTHTSI